MQCLILMVVMTTRSVPSPTRKRGTAVVSGYSLQIDVIVMWPYQGPQSSER